MEDPTLGVKLNNKFEFESELLNIDFYVSGRAIFKDKDVDIENPVGDLVDLHVTVLDKDNKAYEDYEAYAIENIGAKDVAQVTALKLKFTYMGHELDMSKCDVKAEINAKEVFFTDIIGSVPDDIYYTSTNHPMATPNDDLLPLAKAVTVAQSTTTELAELPVVYTSDASEVSTLTVDVKGNSMAVVTSSVEDYLFKVAYYVEVDKPVLVPYKERDTTQKYFKFNDRRKDISINGYMDTTDIYDVVTATKADGTTWNKNIYVPFEGDNIKYAQLVPHNPSKTTSELVSGDLCVFKRETQSIMAYRTEKLKFSEHNSLFTVNKLANSDNYADPTLYTNVTEVNDSFAENDKDGFGMPHSFNNAVDVFEQDDVTGKKIDGTSYNFELLFSNIPGSSSRIYIQEDSTLVLVYKASDSQKNVRDDVTLIDYDNTDGEITTQHAVRADDRGINSIYSKTANGAKFMFGEAWAFTGDHRSQVVLVNNLLDSSLFANRQKFYINDNVVNSNETYSDSSYVPRHFLYGLVYDVDTSDGDFVPVFDSAFSTPDLFSTTNDFIPDTLEKDDLLVKDDLVGAYKCGDEYFQKNGAGPKMDKWNQYAGNGSSYLIFNNLTTNSGYTSGRDLRNINRDDYVEIPYGFVNKDTGFTIEFKFGGINLENVTSNVFNILSVYERYLSGDEGLKFNLYIDRSNNELRINSVGQIKKDLKVADAKLVDNGNTGEKRCDLLTNSTLSITYDCKDEDVLRIYIDGVEVFSYKASLESLGLTKNLILGTNRQFPKATYESRRIRIQIKEIRIYERALRSTGVAQNAKYDGNYAPTVSDGLVAEYDADTVEIGTKGNWQPLAGGNSTAEITMADNVNYKFNGKGCVVTGTADGRTISIPQDVLNQMTGNFTIEIEFGNVKNISNKTQYIGAGTLGDDNSQEFIIWSSDDTPNEDRKYRLCLALDGAYINYQLDKGTGNLKDDISADSVSYSTLSFVYDQTSKNKKTYVYVNGVKIAENGSMFIDNDQHGDGKISLDGLTFGPNTEGSVVEYRTIRFYKRALKHHEVVQNSMHDGTYNAGKFQYTNNGANTMTNGTNTESFGSMGKTVIGGREIEFIREGDKYILSSINVSSYNRKEAGDSYNFTYGNETDLDKFVYYGGNSFQSSNWPLDHTKTYDPDGEIFGHDVPYGSILDKYQKRYPYSGYNGSADPTGPPRGGDYDHPDEWRYFKTTNDGVNHNAFFAMKYKIDFILDKDYVGDLEYLFQGDDDLWIFLQNNNNPDDDIELVVDIGGIHASEGQIVDLWNYIDEGGRYENRISDGNYTLYIFLLERGAKASTCYMEFTIPAIASLRESEATGGLAISKTVENVETDQVFEFTIVFDKTFAGGMYTITKADGIPQPTVQFGTDMDNDDNIFDGSLKIELSHGDVVVVSGVPLGVNYTVTEKSEIYYHTSYKKNLETLREGNEVTGEISATMDRLVFYNTMGVELPATGESGVVAYFIPFIVATAWMFTMPYMDKTNKWRAKGRRREK